MDEYPAGASQKIKSDDTSQEPDVAGLEVEEVRKAFYGPSEGSLSTGDSASTVDWDGLDVDDMNDFRYELPLSSLQKHTSDLSLLDGDLYELSAAGESRMKCLHCGEG